MPKAPWTMVKGAKLLTRKREPRPVRKVSSRRFAANRIYRTRKAIFLTKRTHCFCCRKFVPRWRRTLHHLRGRDGSLFLDERYWRMASNACHDYIHQNPEWAISHGLLGGMGEWGVAAPKGPGHCEGCGIDIHKTCTWCAECLGAEDEA